MSGPAINSVAWFELPAQHQLAFWETAELARPDGGTLVVALPGLIGAYVEVQG